MLSDVPLTRVTLRHCYGNRCLVPKGLPPPSFPRRRESTARTRGQVAPKGPACPPFRPHTQPQGHPNASPTRTPRPPRHPPLAYTYIRSSTNSCARALPLQVTPAFLCPQSSPEVSTRGKPTRPDPSPPQRPTTLSSPILSYKPQAGPTPPLDKLYTPQIRKNTFQLRPVSSGAKAEVPRTPPVGRHRRRSHPPSPSSPIPLVPSVTESPPPTRQEASVYVSLPRMTLRRQSTQKP